MELMPGESREREALAVLLIRSRWYCRSCCLASEPQLERGWEVRERELRGERGAGLELLDENFAGWYIGSPARLRLCAGTLGVKYMLIEDG